MKNFSILAAAIILALLPCTAFANPSCPEGMVSQLNPETNAIVCVPQNTNNTDAVAQTGDIAQNADTTKKVAKNNKKQSKVSASKAQVTETQTFTDDPIFSRYDNNASSGFTFGLGIGYGYVLAGDLNLSLGYDIIKNTHDFQKAHIGAGLYVNVHGTIGFPFAAHASFSPTLLVTKNTFRFTAGLGLGGSYINFDGTDHSAGFLLNPEIKFLWFVSTHCDLGFGFDVPVIIGHRTYSEDELQEGKFEVIPMVNTYFTVGFKWNSNK